MLLKKKKTKTMEDHGSLLYRNMEGKQGFFDEIDYEVSSILLELSHPVVFSSDPPLFHKWGRTKKRSCTVFLRPPKISPPCAVIAEMGSTSSSSCLTGDAKKTYPQSVILIIFLLYFLNSLLLLFWFIVYLNARWWKVLWRIIARSWRLLLSQKHHRVRFSRFFFSFFPFIFIFPKDRKYQFHFWKILWIYRPRLV